jgi:hypothetical protein
MKLIEVAESRKRARWLNLFCANTFRFARDQESGVRDQEVFGAQGNPSPETEHPLTPDS